MSISLEKILPSIMAIFVGLGLLVLDWQSNRWALLFVAIIWLFLIIWSYKKIKKIIIDAEDYLAIMLSTTISSFLVLTLLENFRMRMWYIVFIGLSVYVLVSAFVSEKSFALVSQKTLRRVKTIVWIFNGYSFAAFAFALGLFFQSAAPFWLLSLVLGIIFALISAVIWHMYYPVNFKFLIIWPLLITLIMIELVWVFNLLPFGFFVSAFFVSWIWYIIQLLVRFHFGEQGVIWKNQVFFLSSNAVLFIILLFFVKWI